MTVTLSNLPLGEKEASLLNGHWSINGACPTTRNRGRAAGKGPGAPDILENGHTPFLAVVASGVALFV